MEPLRNEIDVRAPIEEVWAAFNDVERIAPCLPGAQLQEIEGEEYRGIVKVKVGPITAQYKGAAHFVERSKDDWRVKLKADGRDTRGAGNANALITATLAPVEAELTHVDVVTDLTITGKVAQFGRGAIADVSGKLIGQFASNLETMIEEGTGAAPVEAAPAPPDAAAAAGVRTIDSAEPEALDLLEVAGGAVWKRALPAIGIAIILLFVLRRILRSGD